MLIAIVLYITGSTSREDDTNLLLIIGVAIGAFVLLVLIIIIILIVICIWCIVRQKKNKKDKDLEDYYRGFMRPYTTAYCM